MTYYLDQERYELLIERLYLPEILFGQQTRKEHIAAALCDADIVNAAHREDEA